MTRTSVTPSRGGIIQRDVVTPFHSLHREMNRLFDDIFHRRAQIAAQEGSAQPLMPSMDISETDNEIRIRAELPGVSESDIDVSLDGDVLIIRGEKKFEKADDSENYHVVERSYGTFQRALQLPSSVAPNKIRAEFNDGVLTVTLPKPAEQETSHKIPVVRASEQTTPKVASATASATLPPAAKGAPASDAKGKPA